MGLYPPLKISAPVNLRNIRPRKDLEVIHSSKCTQIGCPWAGTHRHPGGHWWPVPWELGGGLMGLKGSGRRCGQNFGNGRVNKTDLGLAPLVALGSLVKCPVLGCACIDLLGSAPCLPKPQAGPVQDYVLKGNANHLEAASCLEAVKIYSIFVKVILGLCQSSLISGRGVTDRLLVSIT